MTNFYEASFHLVPLGPFNFVIIRLETSLSIAFSEDLILINVKFNIAKVKIIFTFCLAVNE